MLVLFDVDYDAGKKTSIQVTITAILAHTSLIHGNCSILRTLPLLIVLIFIIRLKQCINFLIHLCNYNEPYKCVFYSSFNIHSS